MRGSDAGSRARRVREREPQPQRRRGSRSAAVAVRSSSLPGCSARPAGRCSTRSARSSGSRRPSPRSSRCPRRAGYSSPRTRARGSSSRTARNGCSARYREASWSPFGRFVVASRPNELVALTPEGDVRWSLARPNIRFPRWGGTRTDTRIAYLSGDELRVVGGDGKGDRLLDRRRPRRRLSGNRGRTRARLCTRRRNGAGGQRRHGCGARCRMRRACSRRTTRPWCADSRAAATSKPVRSPDSRWLAGGLAGGRPARLRPRSAAGRSGPSRTCRPNSARSRFRRSAVGAARPDRTSRFDACSGSTTARRPSSRSCSRTAPYCSSSTSSTGHRRERRS